MIVPLLVIREQFRDLSNRSVLGLIPGLERVPILLRLFILQGIGLGHAGFPAGFEDRVAIMRLFEQALIPLGLFLEALLEAMSRSRHTARIPMTWMLDLRHERVPILKSKP